jgi:hypothetical protein
MKYSTMSVDDMISIASHTSYGVGRHMKNEVVVSEYGATPYILIELWKLLCPVLTTQSKPHHMLWWLYNCKHYPTKQLLHKALRVSPPTARKYMKTIKEAFLKIRHKVVRKNDISILRFIFCNFTRLSSSNNRRN